MTTLISTFTDLQSWNGTGVAALQNNLTINVTDLATLPAVVLHGSSEFHGNGFYILIQNLSDPLVTVAVRGLFSIGGDTTGVVIKELTLIPQGCFPKLFYSFLIDEIQDTSETLPFISIQSVALQSNLPGDSPAPCLLGSGGYGAGGLIGNTIGADLSDLQFQDCYCYVSMIASNVGGLSGTCGSCNVTFNKCYSRVSSWSIQTGGMAGLATYRFGVNNIIFNDCIVLSDTNLGSVCGGFTYKSSLKTQFNRCYSVCGYDGVQSCGGFLYTFDADNGGDIATLAFDQCYFYQTSPIPAPISGSRYGPFVGANGVYVYSIPPSINKCATSENYFILNSDFTVIDNGTEVIINWGGEYNGIFSDDPEKFDTSSPPLLLAFKDDTNWNNTDYTAYNVPLFLTTQFMCLFSDTMILTPLGEKRIDTLNKGDHVTTPDGDREIISLIHLTRIGVPDNLPYVIKKGRFDGLPSSDLRLSRYHAFHYQGHFHHPMCYPGVGEVDTSLLGREIDYYHICLKEYPQIIYANGLPVESCGKMMDKYTSHKCSKEKCEITVNIP